MEKKHLVIGVIAAVLVVGGVMLAPSEGGQGLIFQNTSKNLDVKVDNKNKDINKLVAKDQVEVEEFDLLSFESRNEDGVVYFDGECAAPGSKDGAAVINKGSNANAYNQWVQSMRAELESNKIEQNGQIKVKPNCPYLVEIFNDVEIERPMVSLVCQNEYRNSGLTGGGFTCDTQEGFKYNFSETRGNWSAVSQVIEGMRLENVGIWFWTGTGAASESPLDLPIRVTRVAEGYTIN